MSNNQAHSYLTMAYTPAQVRIMLNREQADHRSEIEWREIVSRTFHESMSMADVAGVVGAGETLRSYLIAKKKHQVFAGIVVEIQELLKTQSDEHRAFFESNHPFVIWLRTSAYDASALILAIQNTLDEPPLNCIKACTALIQWCKINVPEIVQLKDSMSRYVNLGGQPQPEGAKALYRIAYPLHKKYGNRWKEIVGIIEARFKDAFSDLTTDEHLVFGMWQGKTYKEKRDQLRKMFPTEIAIEGI